jgi:hypothetical protein
MADLKPKATTLAIPSRYTVTTIAGDGAIEQDVDGVGKKASFLDAWGLAVAKNGDIYVATINGNNIRKIVQDSIVSTIAFPPSEYGARIPFGPTEVAVSDDGTITFAQIGDFQSSGSVVSYKPNTPGSLVNREGPNFQGFSGVSLDPDNNFVWLCVNQEFVDAYQIYTIEPPLKKLTPSILQVDFTGLDARFTGIVACENNVKFLVSNGVQLYKLTNNTLLAPTLTNLVFKNITSIAATKDAKTIYLVDDKFIRKVNVNAATVETIAGPDGSNTNRDGIGRGADVNALKLALSADEKSLYFDGDFNVIRKITLQ